MEVVLQLGLWSWFSSCMVRRCSYFVGLYGESHVWCLVNAVNALCLPDILIFEGILNLCGTVESWLSQLFLQGEKPPHPLLQSLGLPFFHWLDSSWIFHSTGGFFFSFSFFINTLIFIKGFTVEDFQHAQGLPLHHLLDLNVVLPPSQLVYHERCYSVCLGKSVYDVAPYSSS